MIAIETKYLPATNTKGARVVATGGTNRIVVSWDYSLNILDVHAKAAKMLCEKMGWDGKLVSGGTKKGYVFCFDQSEKF